jgi:predicted dehydrogenase
MNARLIGSLGAQISRRTDMPAGLAERTRAAMSAAIEIAIGSVLPDRANAYQLLLALGSHDLSAMRELLGPPRGILYARQHHGGRVITAALDYGTYVCQLEVGLDTLPRYETYFQVHSESEVIRVDYDTPYIRHVPAKLQITNLDGDAGIADLKTFPSRRDAFSLQWQAFYENVRLHRQPKTSLADARQDLVIARDLLGQMA